MHCVHCGTENKAPGSLFCFQCGKAIDAAGPLPDSATLIAPNVVTLASLGWPFWLAAFFLLFSFVLPFLPDFAGAKLPPTYFGGQVFWTGVLFAHVWKKRGRSGWGGFGIGALVAIAAIAVGSFTAGAWRALHAG